MSICDYTSSEQIVIALLVRMRELAQEKEKEMRQKAAAYKELYDRKRKRGSLTRSTSVNVTTNVRAKLPPIYTLVKKRASSLSGKKRSFNDTLGVQRVCLATKKRELVN